MTVELFDTGDRARMDEAIALRIAVFVEEQRVPLAEEVDAHDAAGDRDALHALVRDDTAAAGGTGRLVRDATGVARIGRMAVRADLRGRGVGRTILAALVARAAQRGDDRVVLNAQEHAVPFYARAGFVAAAETNLDCGIVHREMTLTFTAPSPSCGTARSSG